MIDQEKNKQETTDKTENKITLTQLGFRSAEKSKSNPESIIGSLDVVYDIFLKDQKLDEQGLKDKIAKLKAEVLQDKSKKQEIIADLNIYKVNKEDKEKEIEELEIQKIDIKNGEEESTDIIPFVIGSFITILLTMYLFVFYSSSGYSAFYGIKPGSLGFINSNVFVEASNKGGGVIALIILFPVIFLGLGFLIHDSLENNKKLTKENKPSNYLLIISLLILTFIADAFIGYKISEGVHNNEFNAGRTNELWNFKMIFSDINFYLVLVLGFAVYVIWGFLLHYVLGHPYLKTASEKEKLLIENLNNKISERRTELSEMISKIHRLDSDINSIESRIEGKQNDIIGYENGVIPINLQSLLSAIGEFMGGWQNYTHGNLTKTQSDILIENALKVQENWLNRKIDSLKTDN